MTTPRSRRLLGGIAAVALVGGLTFGLPTVVGAAEPAAVTPDPGDPPSPGGIGEETDEGSGGGSTDEETETPTDEGTETPTDEGTETPTDDEVGTPLDPEDGGGDPAPTDETEGSDDSDDSDDESQATTSDDDGGGAGSLIAAVVGFVLGLLVAGVPLLVALGRRKAPTPAAPAPGVVPGAPPVVAPAPTPAIAPAPPRVDDTSRTQRAALVAALIGLRDQVPSQALADDAARALREAGVTEVRPDGQPFDPSRHRAVDQVAVADPAQHNVVVSTERPGYLDGSAVLRQPDVVVGRHGGGS